MPVSWGKAQYRRYNRSKSDMRQSVRPLGKAFLFYARLRLLLQYDGGQLFVVADEYKAFYGGMPFAVGGCQQAQELCFE